eukprot:scaffold63_cov306-Pinguiococcus_pyrenoidosus.AAC.13
MRERCLPDSRFSIQSNDSERQETSTPERSAWVFWTFGVPLLRTDLLRAVDAPTTHGEPMRSQRRPHGIVGRRLTLLCLALCLHGICGRLTSGYLSELLAFLDAQVPAPGNNGETNNANADYFGGVVRLSFHDAAGHCPNCPWKGGADACLDFTDPENNGLQGTASPKLPERGAPSRLTAGDC